MLKIDVKLDNHMLNTMRYVKIWWKTLNLNPAKWTLNNLMIPNILVHFGLPFIIIPLVFRT